jgi:hypothetical protein
MKIERAITRAVSEKRRGLKIVVCATDLVSNVYGNNRPTRGQLLAVLHAMQAFVRKHRAYVLAGGQGPSRLSIITADELSSAAARRATPGGASATPPRAPGAPPRLPGSST